jgi:hypothetical protein
MTARRKKPDPFVSIAPPPSPASPHECYVYKMRAEILLAAASPPSSRRVDTEGMQEERRATDALIKHYREVKRHGRMQDIDIGVRLFCEDLKVRNGGKLPSPKGGRPAEEHEHFRIAFWINERLAELGECARKRRDRTAGSHGPVLSGLRSSARHLLCGMQSQGLATRSGGAARPARIAEGIVFREKAQGFEQSFLKAQGFEQSFLKARSRVF